MKQLNLFHDWKYNSWLFAGVLMVCFAVSAGMRYQQFETWKKTPTAYFVGERPLMTTLDAPFWLGLAREYNDVTFGGDAVQRKDRGIAKHSNTTTFIPAEFQEPSPTSSGTSEINYRDVLLLSFLIAHLSFPELHQSILMKEDLILRKLHIFRYRIP